MDFRAAPCCWPKATRTLVGIPAVERNTWTFSDLLYSSTVGCFYLLGYVLPLSVSSINIFLQSYHDFVLPSRCVGESVEENANVVVRLLIRRPECFGPALRGEGGNGLLAAIEEAIKISEDPARDGPSVKKDRRFPM